MEDSLGAFYILVIGYVVSLVCFIGENVYLVLAKHRKRRLEARSLNIVLKSMLIEVNGMAVNNNGLLHPQHSVKRYRIRLDPMLSLS